MYIQLCISIDYNNVFSIGAFIGDLSNQKMIGNATYYYNPRNNTAEFSFTVNKEWRGHGVGSYLLNHLIIIAKEKGIKGFYGTIHIQNKSTIHLFQGAGYTKVTPPGPGENELFFELFFEKE